MMVDRQLAAAGPPEARPGPRGVLKRVWEWKAQHGGRIVEQMKRAGDSCDWSRERFTMDPGLSRAVREAFVRLYEKGLIYRGNYIVNWCPRCQTALSDLEVEHEDTQGHLWHIALSGEWQFDEAGGRDHAPGNDAGRYRGRDQSERSAREGAGRQDRRGCR